MAPPPPATLPLGERLKALAQTLQYVNRSFFYTLTKSSTRRIHTNVKLLLQVCLVCRVCQAPRAVLACSPPMSTSLIIRRHLTLLLSVLRYTWSFIFFNYYSSAAQLAYRLAFISAAVTYGIVVYKGHFARGVSGNVPTIVTKLISDENVQYLGKWLTSTSLHLVARSSNEVR